MYVHMYLYMNLQGSRHRSYLLSGIVGHIAGLAGELPIHRRGRAQEIVSCVGGVDPIVRKVEHRL